MTGEHAGGGVIDAGEAGLDDDAADFVVVGSGAGGGAAARTLARSGARVIVLEEGPAVPAGALGRAVKETMATLFRNQGKQTAFGRATIPILQGRCVGGSTFVNSAIVWRLPDPVLAAWHRDFGLADGLPAAALDAAYARIEEEMSVRPVTEDATAGLQDLRMRQGAERAGVAGRFLHRYERGCHASGRCFHGCPYEAKQSTAVNYLRRAAGDGAVVYANARVDRVTVERSRARAVVGSSRGGDGRLRRFRISARRAVVVAASAVQSPNLLRRSGLRHPHLGRHFMAHPGTSVTGLYPQPVGAWTGASQGFEVVGMRDAPGLKLESINVPPEVTAARFPGVGAALAGYVERLGQVATWAVAVRAAAEGRVRPSRLFGDRIDYDLGEEDVDRLRRGVKRLAQMHFLAGASEVLPGIFGVPEVLRSIDETAALDQAPLDVRAYSLVATHLFGGCRAGRDPAGAVVDPGLRVHGVDGLYVMDASVFPSNTGVNPQHSIMAVATVAAERLC